MQITTETAITINPSIEKEYNYWIKNKEWWLKHGWELNTDSTIMWVALKIEFARFDVNEI